LSGKIELKILGGLVVTLMATFIVAGWAGVHVVFFGLLVSLPLIFLWEGFARTRKKRRWGKLLIGIGSALLLCYGMAFAYAKWLSIGREAEVSAWECLGNLYADVGVGTGRSYSRQLRVTLSIPVLEGNESKVPLGFAQVAESDGLRWVGHQDTFEPYAVFAWSGPISIYDVRRQVEVKWHPDGAWFERWEKIWPVTGSQGCS
jgi:hypothetical protein